MAVKKVTKKPVRKKKKKDFKFENPDHNMQDIDFGEAMSNGFGSYSSYVIYNRSLPDVRDGLLPVQRRSLYGMYEKKWFSNKPHVKSARIVGEIMGNYHPHGDSGIYGAVSRMSKEWIMGITPVDMSGNNGSIDGDSPAAMRYCVTGDTLVSMGDGTLKRIDSLVKDSEHNTTYDISETVLDFEGKHVHASKFFNSGEHTIHEMVLENGIVLKGSYNHPLLTLRKNEISWKLLSELVVGDYIVTYIPELKKMTNVLKDSLDNLGNAIYGKSKVVALNVKREETVYSIKVDTKDHSFIANGLINHNTESRLSKYSEDILLSNLSLKGIIPEVLNYDDTKYEPTILPAKVPNILVNGSEGIGVGYASSIPPFNLEEILDACIAEIEKPNIEDDELISYIPAPDFPTGGVISGYKSFDDVIKSGRGAIKVRGAYTIEDNSQTKGKDIIFTEIPYECIKPKVIDTINEAILNKEVSGILKARDDSDTDGINLTIECSENANIDGILGYLFTKTTLQKNVNLNMTVISNNKPKTLGVPDVIREFNIFRRETFRRGLELQIVDLEYKRHLNEGFVFLVANIEEVITLIKESDSKKDAFEKLKVFGFSGIQANKVLEMSLHRINKSEKSVFEDIVKECNEGIEYRKEVLASDELVNKALIHGYLKIKKEYPTPRKTALVVEPELWEFSPESIIPRESMVVGVTRDGFVKVSSYRSYKTTTLENDAEYIIESDSTKSIIIITEKGDCAYIPIHKLPISKWSAQGKHLSTFGLDIGNSEVVFVCDFDGKDKTKTIFLLKDNGLAKQSYAFDYVKAKGHFSLTSGIKCKEDEKVLAGWLLDTNVENYIALMDDKGASMYFEVGEMPITGAKSAGASAIRINKKKGGYVQEYMMYQHVEDIPPFCKVRERGQAGWRRFASDKVEAFSDYPLNVETEKED